MAQKKQKLIAVFSDGVQIERNSTKGYTHAWRWRTATGQGNYGFSSSEAVARSVMRSDFNYHLDRRYSKLPEPDFQEVVAAQPDQETETR